MASLYRTGPNGLPGNDDLGTMSAWYVFAALGMYPQTPSRAEALLSSPMFERAWIKRDGGPTITVSAPQASARNVYVQSVSVNGRTDGIATADAKAQGNLDGKGWSFPAEQMPSTVSLDGVDHAMPETRGTAGNFVSLRGQRIYAGTGQVSALDLLVTAVNGDQQTDVVLTYADGSTSVAHLAVTDWAGPAPHFGEQPALSATTRYNINGTADGRAVHIRHVRLATDSTRTLASISSPATPNIKIFAMTTS